MPTVGDWSSSAVITLILATIAWHWLAKTDGTSLLNDYTKAVWRWILVGCWILLSLEVVRKVVVKWFSF